MVVLEEGMSNPSFILSPGRKQIFYPESKDSVNPCHNLNTAFINQKFVKILASALKEVNNPTDISFAILAKME
jgi:hypothetical protein